MPGRRSLSNKRLKSFESGALNPSVVQQTDHNSGRRRKPDLPHVPGKTNHLMGDDPEQWHTNIPTYAKVRYREVYPGVDLVYYGRGRQLEYDFMVAPAADPSAIRLAFEGSDSVTISQQGDQLWGGNRG